MFNDIENSTINPEVKKIINRKTRPNVYDYKITLHTVEKDMPILKLINMDKLNFFAKTTVYIMFPLIILYIVYLFS